MASFAAAAEGGLVHVLTQMAAVAGRNDGGFASLLHRRFVTGVALQFYMRAVQHETGLVMIVIPALPGARVVTGLAIDAEPAFVYVVFFVAGVAVRGRVLESHGGFVTLLAFYDRMAALQRKP